MTFAETFYKDRFTYREYLDDRLTTVVQLVATRHRGRPITTLLDIGCGSGVLLEALRDLTGVRGSGIELNDAAIDEARARGFEVHKLDVGHGTRFASDSLDLVVMGEVLEHLVDPDIVIEEIRRILKPGGTFIVTTPNLAAWFNRGLLLAGIQPIFSETNTKRQLGRKWAFLGQGFPVQGHLRLYTLGSLKDFIKMHNFKINAIRGCTFPVSTLIALADQLLKKLPYVAAGLIIQAEKPAEAEA